LLKTSIGSLESKIAAFTTVGENCNSIAVGNPTKAQLKIESKTNGFNLMAQLLRETILVLREADTPNKEIVKDQL
jgi:arabinogalactan endo-1,4-beta-galactosidase